MICGNRDRTSDPLFIVVPQPNTGGPGNRGNTIAGVNVPPDIGWTACTVTKGTGTLDARMIAGIVYLRGTIKITGVTSGNFTQVSALPQDFIGPDSALVLPAHAIQTGVAYRIGEVRLDRAGAIGVAATTGAMDTVYFDGVQFTIF